MSHGTRIYVAGASKEMDRAKAAMRDLEASGFVITLDWTQQIEAVGKPDSELTGAELIPHAVADLAAVAGASIFLLLHPENESTGAWTELGYALRCRNERAASRGRGDQLEILISGGRRGIFWSLADKHFPNDAAAVWYLRGRVGVP
jgi:hypothetical protein